MNIAQFNWRSLQRFASPQATKDFNLFLENLPRNTNQYVLIAAGVVWFVAGGIGIYTFVQSKALAEKRAELMELDALKPSVPSVTNVAENASQVQNFVEKAQEAYPNLKMSANGSSINIEADETRFFPQFREAIGHIQNGGRGWRVNIEEICVGRECESNPLAIRLKVNRVSIETKQNVILD